MMIRSFKAEWKVSNGSLSITFFCYDSLIILGNKASTPEGLTLDKRMQMHF